MHLLSPSDVDFSSLSSSLVGCTTEGLSDVLSNSLGFNPSTGCLSGSDSGSWMGSGSGSGVVSEEAAAAGDGLGSGRLRCIKSRRPSLLAPLTISLVIAPFL